MGPPVSKSSAQQYPLLFRYIAKVRAIFDRFAVYRAHSLTQSREDPCAFAFSVDLLHQHVQAPLNFLELDPVVSRLAQHECRPFSAIHEFKPFTVSWPASPLLRPL